MRYIRWMITLHLPPDIKSALLKKDYIYIGVPTTASASNHDMREKECPNPTVTFTVTMLTGHCEDKPVHKQDAEFLDKFQELLDRYDGKLSTGFNPDLMRFKQVNSKARQTFKARFR